MLAQRSALDWIKKTERSALPVNYSVQGACRIASFEPSNANRCNGKLTVLSNPDSPPTFYRRVLIWMLSTDAALILLYIAAGLTVGFAAGSLGRFVDIGSDQSVPEYWNILKWIGTVVLLATAARLTRNAMLWGLCAVFCLVLLDDGFRIHETFGIRAVALTGLSDTTALRAQDIGELIVDIALGSMALLAVMLGYMKSSRIQLRQAAPFFWVLAGLAFCAIGLDMMHSVATRTLPATMVRFADAGMTILEDGGEMVVGSFGVAHAVDLVMRLWKVNRHAGCLPPGGGD
ncbi:MAG: hypothetical protein NTZ61_00950 [Proteobacteria bacterium]|nr:hypothetical protein [Pseudomonadota bacterium]